MPLLLLIFWAYGWINSKSSFWLAIWSAVWSFFGHFHHSFHWHGSDETAGRFNSAAWQANLSRGEVSTSALASGVSYFGSSVDAVARLCD